MSRVTRNILINFIGRGWAALAAVIFVPFYIKLMGIEAFGLVGVALTLQVLFSPLDFGLSAALNREMTRLASPQSSAQEARDLVRTLEVIYWAAACAIALLVALLAPILATHWINPSLLSVEEVERAVLLMGVMLALQFPFALYSGGLMGLQRQELVNALTITTATLQAIGAILILRFVSPTVSAFFLWQAGIGALQTILSAVLLWRLVPRSDNVPRFRKAALLRVRTFAAGMATISVLTLLLSQADKIILSRIMPLEAFGYYSLASSIASRIVLLVDPIFAATFPRFAELIARGKQESVIQLYHASAQLSSIAAIPAAVVLATFSPEILLVWTRDRHVIDETYLTLSLLTVGFALNALMCAPYALQLAQGWTRLVAAHNLIAACLFLPALMYAARRYGAVGAAYAWIALNLSYLIINVPLMHKHLLRGERGRFYLRDLGPPIAGTLAVVAVWWILPRPSSFEAMALWIGAAALSALATSALLAPIARERAWRLLATLIG